MKTFNRPNLMLALAAAGLIAGTAQCKNSNSIAGPAPAANVAGAWTGTFVPGDPDCGPNPAQASFTVEGQSVVGTLSAPGGCGFQYVQFQGTIDGNILKGTVSGDISCAAGGSVYGPNGANLDLGLSSNTAGRGEGLLPGGQMHLHR
jgi:hypothetical protein